MSGLVGSDGAKMEGTRNLLGYEEWCITSGEEGLDEVGGVSVELTRMVADLPPMVGEM